MDPILEEMARTKGASDIKDSRFRDWVQYLCALFVAKEDEIARLRLELQTVKRGPGRPRTCQVCGEPETRHAATCASVEAVARG